VGIQFVLSIAVGAWGGNWLDEQFDTTPLLLIVGVLLGATAAYRDLAKLARDHDALESNDDESIP
jgi:F0F1-type ATP synthase assembly protein I